MNINDLTTQQKSDMLAKAMDWHIANLPLPGNCWKRVLADKDGNDLGLVPYGGGTTRIEMELTASKKLNLYQEVNFHLAWRVLNWAMESKARVEYKPLSEETEPFDYELGFAMYDWFCETVNVAKMPPAQAQAAWLDKILELAIEAGLAAGGGVAG